MIDTAVEMLRPVVVVAVLTYVYTRLFPPTLPQEADQ